MIVSSPDNHFAATKHFKTVLRKQLAKDEIAYISDEGVEVCFHDPVRAERRVTGATSEPINWEP